MNFDIARDNHNTDLGNKALGNFDKGDGSAKSRIRLKFVVYPSSTEEDSGSERTGDVLPQANSTCIATSNGIQEASPKNAREATTGKCKEKFRPQHPTGRSTKQIRPQYKAQRKVQVTGLSHARAEFKVEQNAQRKWKVRLQSFPRLETSHSRADTTQEPYSFNQRTIIKFRAKPRTEPVISSGTMPRNPAPLEKPSSAEQKVTSEPVNEALKNEPEVSLVDIYGIKPATDDNHRYTALHNLVRLYVRLYWSRSRVQDFEEALEKLCSKDGYEVILGPAKIFEEIMPLVSSKRIVEIFDSSVGHEAFAANLHSIHQGKNFKIMMDPKDQDKEGRTLRPRKAKAEGIGRRKSSD